MLVGWSSWIYPIKRGVFDCTCYLFIYTYTALIELPNVIAQLFDLPQYLTEYLSLFDNYFKNIHVTKYRYLYIYI